MGFVGVYTAVYDYQPQAEGELEIHENDLLYILDKDDDDWWKAKKKADPEDDEPVGLVPNNYVQEAQPTYKAKALYDYTRQTDEEISFSEDAELSVYDTTDPDWTLVGSGTDFGFAPANYIQLLSEIAPSQTPAVAQEEPEPEPVSSYTSPEPEPSPPPSLPQRPVHTEPEEYASAASSPAIPDSSPAAAIAGMLHRQHGSMSSHDTSRAIPPAPQAFVSPEEEEEEGPAPSLPTRPISQPTPPREVHRYEEEPASPPQPPRPQHLQVTSARDDNGRVQESPPYSRVGYSAPSPRSPSGYRLYNINEMISVLGKRKKMPTTLGLNVPKGTIFISADSSENDTQQEWTADKLTHYSIEGKHVFIELVKPSKSVDFHAGSKDTAHEIVAALGEISGAYRAEGLREVLEAGQGGSGIQKKGQMLYDFMAQGEDEVTVATGDEVVVLDDSKSDEWWMVRRIKNGREGVVPSSYVEITGLVEASTPATSASKSTAVDQNRHEEERLAKEASRRSRVEFTDGPRSEVGPGMTLPKRHSSLFALDVGNNGMQRHKREKSDKTSKQKPDTTKIRNWTDRTGTFSVEAQFLGLHDGKIHLHKMNGIKIAVPTAKMSVEDLEYVEKVTGESLDEDKPLSDIRRRSMQAKKEEKEKAEKAKEKNGVHVQEYDWFDFFLKAGVGPHQCERYAQNFSRTLWTKPSCRILRLKLFSRLRNVSFGGEEVIGNGETGLFSGAGGALKNNTSRKGRPAPAVQTGDVVDPKAFEVRDGKESAEKAEPAPVRQTTPPAEKPVQRGFDDDAWDVKRPKESSAPAATAAAAAAPAPVEPPKPAPPTGAMADLSLLQAPLKPTPAPSQPTPPAAVPAAAVPPPTVPVLAPMLPQQTATLSYPQPAAPQQPQATGANPGFFQQLGPLQPQQTAVPNQPQGMGFSLQPRQRPVPPQTMNQNSLLPPPPQRPLSAPQDFQQSPFAAPPLQPQLTGIPRNAPQLAPTGQSLAELNQQRFQPQQYGQLQPQLTAFPQQQQPQFQNGLMPQPTGFQPQSQFGFQQQQQQQQQQQFAGMAPQPTGFGGFSPPPQQPMATGINGMLPPALQPQQTAVNGFGTSISPPPPLIPPIPQMPTVAPLQPQKTGPAPPVRFGVKHDAKKLTPQPTGMRANLAQATPSNPFGF
uniref:Actin cytoskeleton-regulatory complex protein SLA1 n=1 Tax=Talaromyces marneffei PM1 TaxID=1077442 RepID=A0A093V7C4_TALMA